MKPLIFWFRDDLRLDDNPAWRAAVQQNRPLIPVYIWHEPQVNGVQFGLPRMGDFRKQFLAQSLENLSQHLEINGGSLQQFFGRVPHVLRSLCVEYETDEIIATASFTQEEMEMEKTVRGFARLNLVEGKTLLHPDDLPFEIDNLPDVFTAFRKKVEKHSPLRQPLPDPGKFDCPIKISSKLPSEVNVREIHPHENTALKFMGGQDAAFARMKHYLWDTEKIATYKETRNGLMGEGYSSKFSAWLAAGCLSPRRIYNEVKKFEREVTANESTYWLIFELLWRDFFQFAFRKKGAALFRLRGMAQNHHPPTGTNSRLFEKWRTGQTGDDFMDANMRELLLTGFMSNRGRQNVASYFVHQLKMDWRLGAAWFEHQLIDYDPASNWGNWAYCAGVGHDPRQRVFNTQRQAQQYDPDRHFRRLWLNL